MFTGSAVRPELAKTLSSLAPSNPALCTVAHETIRRLKLPQYESAPTVPLANERASASFWSNRSSSTGSRRAAVSN